MAGNELGVIVIIRVNCVREPNYISKRMRM